MEDDAGITRRLVQQLEFLGLDVTSADTAGAGLALVDAAIRASRPFDVCFVDLNLPDFPGLELIRSAAALSPAPYIVVVTGVTEPVVARACAQAGANWWVNKPFALVDIQIALAFMPPKATPSGEIIG